MFMLQISGIEIIEYKRSLQNLTDYYCIPRILVNHMLLEYWKQVHELFIGNLDMVLAFHYVKLSRIKKFFSLECIYLCFVK